MKRLTFEGNFCDIAQCFQLPTCDKDDYCSQRKVWERLKEYEDTGLEPEEIERIVDAYGRGVTLREEVGQRIELIRRIKIDRLRELVKAEREGRVVVLPFGSSEDVGSSIREARKRARLTQKELGDRIGLSQQSIAIWENGYRRPKLTTMCKIADALKVETGMIGDTCICCGAIVPEGRMVCPNCERGGENDEQRN